MHLLRVLEVLDLKCIWGDRLSHLVYRRRSQGGPQVTTKTAGGRADARSSLGHRTKSLGYRTHNSMKLGRSFFDFLPFRLFPSEA